MLLARSICWRQRDRDVVKLRSWICPQIKFTVRRISSELKSCRHGGIMMIPNSKNGIPETFSIDELKRSLFGAFKVSADIEMRDYERYFGMPTLARRSGDDRRRSSLHLSDGSGRGVKNISASLPTGACRRIVQRFSPAFRPASCSAVPLESPHPATLAKRN
jgi:hypothetical protein